MSSMHEFLFGISLEGMSDIIIGDTLSRDPLDQRQLKHCWFHIFKIPGFKALTIVPF